MIPVEGPRRCMVIFNDESSPVTMNNAYVAEGVVTGDDVEHPGTPALPGDLLSIPLAHVHSILWRA